RCGDGPSPFPGATMSDEHVRQSGPSTADDITPGALGRIETVCRRFEEAWRQGARPSLEEHLLAVPPPEQAVLLEALLRLDLHFRRQQGEGPGPDEYQRRLPRHEAQLRRFFSSLGAETEAKGTAAFVP